MIATATQFQRAAGPSTPSMVGGKVAMPHRIFLAGGKVLEGDLFRAPNVRLADHLSTLKGLVSVTNVVCQESGTCFPYIVVNMDHVLFIEEVGAAVRPENQDRMEPPAVKRAALMPRF